MGVRLLSSFRRKRCDVAMLDAILGRRGVIRLGGWLVEVTVVGDRFRMEGCAFTNFECGGVGVSVGVSEITGDWVLPLGRFSWLSTLQGGLNDVERC